MSEKYLKINNINKQKVVSNWLTVLQLSEHGFVLNKQELWDAIRLHAFFFISNWGRALELVLLSKIPKFSTKCCLAVA